MGKKPKTKDALVFAVVTAEERQEMEKHAKGANLSRSAFMRRALRDAVGLPPLPEDTTQRRRERWRG